MPIIDTRACQCAQCGHIWIPGEWRRSTGMPLPAWCAKCKSAKWNGAELVTMKPDTRTEEVIADAAPIERQSKVKPKVERKVAKPNRLDVAHPRPTGKKTCPHGFSIIEGGVTLCPQCRKIGA